MENKRAVVISIICFTVSLILILTFVRVRRYELTQSFGEEVQVVVAAAVDNNGKPTPIPEYAVIREDMLRTVTVFKKFLQPQTVSNASLIVGKAAYVPIYPDEQVTLTKLVHQDGRPVLDRQVEKKMRALTIAIAPQTGVGRLIRPGNRVDVLVAPMYEQSGATIVEVKTVFQNVLVLATGKTIQNSVPTHVNREVLGALEGEFEQRRRKDFATASAEGLSTTRPDDNYSNITLQLTPEDAEKLLLLSHAFGDSKIHLTLRNSAESQSDLKLATTLLDDVLGPESDYGRAKKKPPPPPPPRPPRFYDSVGGQVIPRY